jgi:hypothetical protein
LVGALWALWHVGLYQNGALYMLFLVILMIAYSIVLYAIVAGTGFNVWVAALFHLGINLANLPFYTILQDTRFMMINALVWVVVASVVVIIRRDLFLRRHGPDRVTPSPVAAPAARATRQP